MCNKKKRLIIYTLSICSLIISFYCCNEGFIGVEGEPLKEYIMAEQLKTLTENPKEDIWIIDVTPQRHYTKHHIPTAKSFPSDEILYRLDEIPEDKYLIIYCETGARSQRILKILEQKGITKTMNWGSYTRWLWQYESGALP